MTRTEWTLAVGLLGALLLGGVVSRWQWGKATKFEAKAQAAEVLTGKVRNEMVILQSTTDSLAKLATVIDTVVQFRVKRVLVVDKVTPPDTCKPYIAVRDSLISAQFTQNAVLVASVAVRDSSLRLLTTSRDALDAALRARTRPSRILGLFPAPSRTETFFIGAAVGFLAATRLR